VDEVREDYSALQVRPFEGLELEMVLEVLVEEGVVVVQLIEQLQFQRLLGGPDTPTEKPDPNIFAFMLIEKILAEVLTLFLANIEIAQ